ncbi:GEVED domain-containing protein [Fibrella arboris]|uniref:GEVED domain-containing protein n=1 Tax=Fibrella arboris TaxID=3242486 RepID=UPI003521B7F4
MATIGRLHALLVALQLLLVWKAGNAQDICVTPILSTEQMIRQEQLLASGLPRGRSARLAGDKQYLPVRFHVVRRDDGTGGVSLGTLNQAVVLINQIYQPAGIAFYICGGQPDYIDDTALFDYDTGEESALADSHDVLNAINIYILNTINYGGVQASGYAYYPGSIALTNRVFVKANQVTGNSLPHELGHYFNLYHTFEGSNSSDITDRELVIRPGEAQAGRPFAHNCSDTGDLVCDTPADPYGRAGATVSGCVYTGTVTDANGDKYTPLLDNIMSYYAGCTANNTFTAGQYARISAGLALRLSPQNEYSLNCVDNTIAAPTALTVRQTPTGALVQFAYAQSNAAGFLIERSTDPSANFSVVGSTPPGTFSYTDGSVQSNTTYYYRVKASNASTQYSLVQRIDVGLFYCIPTYVFPIANFFPKIDEFILTGSQATLRSVATGAGTAGYSDFSSTVHRVLPGRVYSFTASALTGSSGSYVVQHLTIWLDSNRDGVFSTAEILYQSSAGQLMNPRIQSSISIPASVSIGQARLRLRSQYSSEGLVNSACAAYNYGETEDYTLLIDTPAPPACFTLTASATPAHCAGSTDGSVQLATTGGTGPFSYSLNNLTQATGLFSTLAAGSYVARVTDATCSQSLVVTVGQPEVVVASLLGATAVCGTQSVTLTASVLNGQGPYTLQLSDGFATSAVTGYVSGTPIPVVPSQTRTYQLQALTDANGCPASLVTASAMVTVNPINSLTVSPQNATVCSGQSLPVLVTGGSNYTWTTGEMSAGISVSATGVYSVTNTNPFGCTSAASTTVQAVSCPTSVLFRGRILLEGFTSTTTATMHTLLATGNLLPKQQPYTVSPWLYQGTEQVTTFPANVTDWLLVYARNAAGEVLARKAVFVRSDGILLSPDGSEGVLFPPLTAPIYVSIHHRSHLAIQSSSPITDNQLVDFTSSLSTVRGTNQLVAVGGKLAMYSGDFDANSIINSLDFNKWKLNASSVGRYLSADSDGNGVINNKDFNRWMLNRSKIGTPGL